MHEWIRCRARGWWKGMDVRYANEEANQEAEDRAVMRLWRGRLLTIKDFDELQDAIVEELNSFAERSTQEEYVDWRKKLKEQAKLEARIIPFSDEWPAWHVGIMENVPLWEVEETCEALYVSHEGFDTPKEIQYLADVFQSAINEGTVNKLPQIERSVEWCKKRLDIIQRQGSIQLVSKPELEWLGDKVELAELGYALLESGYIKGPRGKAMQALASFFGVDMGRPEKHLQTMQKRKQGASSTPVLDRLKQAMTQYLGRL